MNVSFLGQGAMGSRMADRLEAAGFIVTRWNRTGAVMSPRQAVAKADVVIAMVRDDEASRAVWLDADTGALPGMKAGAIAIESSTLTVDWVHTLDTAMIAAGRPFIDAPVLGSRPQAEAGALIHLIGGEEVTVDRVRPILAAIGSTQLHAGVTGSGAALKLVANALFGIQVSAIAELIGRCKRLGLDPAIAIDRLSQTPLLSGAAKGAAALMLADQHAPMFPVDLVVKDFNYAIGSNIDAMPLAAAARGVFERAILAGLKDANLSVVGSLY